MEISYDAIDDTIINKLIKQKAVLIQQFFFIPHSIIPSIFTTFAPLKIRTWKTVYTQNLILQKATY